MLNFDYIDEEVLRFKKSLSDLKNTTIVSYCNNVKLFFKYLMTIEKDILGVEKKDVLDYIAKMKEDGLSHSQINCRFAAIKKYYEYLLDCEQFDENRYIKLFNRIKLPKIIAKKQEVYLKDVANFIIDVFMKEMSVDNFTTVVNLMFLVIIAYTGARRNEVATLKVEDIDFRSKYIHFYNTKNNISRHIQVPDKILEMIKKYLIEREKNIKSDTTNLFLNKHGKPTNVASIGANIIMVAKKHGIQMKFHAFRRGFATELSKKNIPIEDICKLLGHSNIEMTRRYIYNDDRLTSAALAYSMDDQESTESSINNNTNNTPNENNNNFDIGNTFNANIQNNNSNIASMINNTSTSEKVEPVRTGGEPRHSNNNLNIDNTFNANIQNNNNIANMKNDTSTSKKNEPVHSNNNLNIGNIFNGNIQNIIPTEFFNFIIDIIKIAANGNNQNVENMASIINNTNTSEKVERVPTGGEPWHSNNGFNMANMYSLFNSVTS